jgi:hypothetical protein
MTLEAAANEPSSIPPSPGTIMQNEGNSGMNNVILALDAAHLPHGWLVTTRPCNKFLW